MRQYCLVKFALELFGVLSSGKPLFFFSGRAQICIVFFHLSDGNKSWNEREREREGGGGEETVRGREMGIDREIITAERYVETERARVGEREREEKPREGERGGR